MTVRHKRAPLTPIAVDIAGVAELLGVGERFAYELRSRPGFPAPRELSPGVRRYLLSELHEWLAAQPVAPVASEPTQLVGRRYRDGKPTSTRRERA